MKKMKKLLSLALACMMALSMVTAASAASPTDPFVDKNYNMTNNEANTSGTISISGIHEDVSGGIGGTAHTQYVVYKMLHLESYSADKEAYSYRVIEEWVDFFKNGEGKNYMTLDDKGYATWTNASKADAVVSAFASKALEYAHANRIDPVMTTKTPAEKDSEGNFTFGYNQDGTNGTFYGLSLGYYLVDSNVGSLCALNTTRPNAQIVAKNEAPTLEKKVKEDSTNEFQSSNTADVGQIVEFRGYIKIPAVNSTTTSAGAQNYVFHDVMTEGLTFDPASEIVVNHVNPDNSSKSLPEISTKDADYEDWFEVVPHEKCQDDCTFEIVFTDEFCKHLEKNDYIYIYYSATLNEKAIEKVNENTAHLTYGEESMHTTTPSKTETYTYGFDLLKTDTNNALLGGTLDKECAIFQIYGHDAVKENTVDGETTYEYVGAPMEFIVTKADDGSDIYRPLMPGETSNAATTVVTNGRVRIVGLDNGVYYLKEIQAPSGGYNILSEPVKVILSNNNLYASYDPTTGAYTGIGQGVKVQNSTGSILPSTGAKGTAMFIGFGAALVIGTGLLLVTKKRMSMIED